MNTGLFSLLLLSNYLLIQRCSCVCPSEDFIQPCSCMTMAFGNHVVCLSINSTGVLRDIFSVLRSYDIHTLLFNALRLDGQPLPSDIFNGLRVQQLRFEDSVFELEVGKSPFQGLESYLDQLDVSNCNIANLDNAAFTHLVRLREVNMNFDAMESLKATWFQNGPVSVRTIKMDHNHFGTIESSAFLGLRNLELISLADNRLQTVNRDVLPRNAIKLNWIDLSYNQLRELPTDMFSNMPRLKRVVLTGNQLTSLPQTTWGAIWSRLDHVLLKDNPIVCDSEMSWAFRQRIPTNLNGSCRSPKELNGIRLATLSVDQLQSG